MKKINIIIISVAAALLLAGCQKETLNPESVIVMDTEVKNDFDRWLEMNYLIPYNIEVKYRYDVTEASYSVYTIPADYDKSVMLAHLVKNLCIDAYDECAGIRFTQSYFPKMFVFYGEWVFNSNGTYTRGSAEGGKKIILYGVNHVDGVVSNNELRTTYIPTIHHEFMHILNQVKDFPTEFEQITPNDYVGSSWSSSPYNSSDYYRTHGFISTYSQMDAREDMAEMLSQYVMYDQTWWDAAMAQAGEVGAPLIGAKLDVMKTYMKDNFNIDLDQLRASIQRRLADIAAGKTDLTSLDID